MVTTTHLYCYQVLEQAITQSSCDRLGYIRELSRPLSHVHLEIGDVGRVDPVDDDRRKAVLPDLFTDDRLEEVVLVDDV